MGNEESETKDEPEEHLERYGSRYMRIVHVTRADAQAATLEFIKTGAYELSSTMWTWH